MGRNSRNEPGQPCKSKMGMASGRCEKRATKWIVKLSSPEERGIVKLGKEFISCSYFRLGGLLGE